VQQVSDSQSQQEWIAGYRQFVRRRGADGQVPIFCQRVQSKHFLIKDQDKIDGFNAIQLPFLFQPDQL
jgi:hypothetical protein